jgi:hypothetical protein
LVLTTAAASRPLPQLDRLAWPLAILLMLLVLLAPALWNGFPFLFADTGGYVARPFEGTLLPGRSALYGTFLAAGLRLDFWPVIVIQAAVTLWVVLLMLRAVVGPVRPQVAFGVILLAALVSALPWYASHLMPDIFVPLAVVCLYLLAFTRDRLRRHEAAGLSVVAAVAIAFHMSILALSVALIAIFACSTLVGLSRPRLGLPIIVILAGVLLSLVSNFAIAGRFAFTPGGTHFAFGRLVQDGIIARYVNEHCPSAKLAICGYAQELPDNADGWLWGWNGPFYKLGGWDGYEAEARSIMRDTLRLYPIEHLKTAVSAALQQLVSFRTGEGINANDLHHALPVLEKLAPNMMPRVRAAAQQNNAFDFTWINRLHLPAAYLAALILVFTLFRRRDFSTEARTLAATVLLALAANAAICGVLSNPNDRYQARMVMLLPLAVAAVLLSHKARRAGDPISAREAAQPSTRACNNSSTI